MGRGEELAILWNVLDHGLDLIDLVCSRQCVVASRVQSSNGREEGSALLFGELGAERIDGDVDGSTIGFKGQNARHDLGRGVT